MSLTDATTSALTKLHARFKKAKQEDLLTELESLDLPALEARIAVSEANIAEQEMLRSEDQDLANLAEQLRDIRGAYADKIKLQRLIQRACSLLSDTKGRPADDTTTDDAAYGGV